MRKNILIFGASGFIAKQFIAQKSEYYKIFMVGRNKKQKFDYYLDFNDIEALSDFQLNESLKIDVVLFFQGLNPKKNLKAINYDHFIEMFNVNIFGPSLVLKNILPNLSNNALCLFISSIASKKGSYDPSYASAKAAISGLIASLVRAYPNIRFNSLSLGLVENSPVHKGMTQDFIEQHSSKMFDKKLVKIDNIISMIVELINNFNINNSNISIDGGYAL